MVMNGKGTRRMPALLLLALLLAGPARAMMPIAEGTDAETARWLADLSLRERQQSLNRPPATAARTHYAAAVRRTSQPALASAQSGSGETAAIAETETGTGTGTEAEAALPLAMVDPPVMDWVRCAIYAGLAIVFGFVLYVLRHVAQERQRLQKIEQEKLKQQSRILAKASSKRAGGTTQAQKAVP